MNPSDIDNLYNLHCLIYNVWELYRNGKFSLEEIVGSQSGEIQGFEVLSFNIIDIKRMYDTNVFKLLNEYSGDKFTKVADFCFNLIVVNLEVLERSDDAAASQTFDIINDCLKLFDLLFNFQSQEVESFLADVKADTMTDSIDGSPAGSASAKGEKMEYETVEQITPDTVLDTLAQGYKLVSTFLENSNDTEELLTIRVPFIQQFRENLDKSLFDLTSVCGQQQEQFTENVPVYALNKTVLNEIQVHMNLISSLAANFDYEHLLSHWNSFSELQAENNNNHDWKLAFVDNLNTFLELHQNNKNLDKVACLNKANELFRDVENTLKLKLKPSATSTDTTTAAATSSVNSQSLDISDHLIKLVECLINRSDNEITKYQMTQNQISLTNSTNILKTALNYLGSINCGLRETMVNKLIKRRLKRQIWIRLIVLEDGKIDPVKIKQKIGEKFYIEDLNLMENTAEVYSMFSTAQ